jgi:hypothetical protein
MPQKYKERQAMNKIGAIKFVDTMQFNDPFYCCNLIQNEKQKIVRQSNVGYFTFAKSLSEAQKKIGHLANKDTNKDDPFTMWDFNMELDKPELVANTIHTSEIWTHQNNTNGRIENLMKKTEDHQKHCIKKLKNIIKHKTKDLIGDDQLSIWTYLYASKRQYHLFDPDGAAIEDRNYLADVLTKYQSTAYDHMNKWFKKYNLYFSEFVVRY